MRYRVKGLEIRSENAAKPMAQASRPLTRWLMEMEPVHSALDFGCGKLRYSRYIAKRSKEITLVDSQIQLDRIQRIGGRLTTVRTYAERNWPGCRVFTAEAFGSDTQRYDFILCANVLSAIPDRSMQSNALLRMGAALRQKGCCLFVTQFRNSYFKALLNSPKAMSHLDGWIIRTGRGNFYYGMLDKSRLIGLVVANGLSVKDAWVDGQSAYVLAGK